MPRALFAAVAAAILPASPALAQIPECATVGDVANVITAPDMTMALALGVGATQTVLPETRDKATREITCTRGGSVAINGVRYTLTGENADAIPRRLVGERAGDPLFYVAPFQNSLDTIAAEIAKRPAPPPKTAYVLVRVDQEGAWVLLAMDAIPRDDQLRAFAQQSPNLAPIAAVKADGKVEVFINTGPGPATARTAPPPQAGRRGAFRDPDGITFTSTFGGGARHAATGFVCPRSLAGNARRELVVYDPAEKGRDVSCGYGTTADRHWHTLYMTHMPDMSAEEVFALWERDARGSAPRITDTKFSPVSGAPPLPERASFWLDSSGATQGLWVSSIDGWHIKLRTTMRPTADPDQVNRMAEAAFKAIYQQLGER